MSGPSPALSATKPPILVAMRRLAAGIRADVDEATLAGLFNQILETVPRLERSAADLSSQAGVQAHFSPDMLTLPLRGDRTLRGVLRHPLEAGPLGVVELETLHASADMLGALAELAARSREARGARAALQMAVDRMPFGVACFGPAGALLACNRVAATFLGSGSELRGLEGLRASLGLPESPASATRCVGRGDRLAVVHVHPLDEKEARDWRGGVVLVHDVSESAASFRDAIARETYRCLVEGEELSLVAIDAAGGIEPLLIGADEIRRGLPASCACGPLGLHAFGLLMPQTLPGVAARFLRGFDAVCGLQGLRIGVASLRGGVRSPDALIRGALEACQPWTSAMRPDVLVFDASPAVTEAVSLVLRADCQVMMANTREPARELVASRLFDGVMLELPAVADDAHLAFVREVVDRQPAARPFFLSEASGPWPLHEQGLPTGPVFRKPFSVKTMRSAVLEALAER